MLQATPVADIRAPEGMAAGAIELREVEGEVRGFAFRCPCGCGQESWLPVNRGQNGWNWDGNRERPTLSPSVLQSGLPCKWHGYLRNGQWENA